MSSRHVGRRLVRLLLSLSLLTSVHGNDGFQHSPPQSLSSLNGLESRNVNASCIPTDETQTVKFTAADGKVLFAYVLPDGQERSFDGDDPQIKCTTGAGNITYESCHLVVPGSIELMKPGIDCIVSFTTNTNRYLTTGLAKEDGKWYTDATPRSVSCYRDNVAHDLDSDQDLVDHVGSNTGLDHKSELSWSDASKTKSVNPTELYTIVPPSNANEGHIQAFEVSRAKRQRPPIKVFRGPLIPGCYTWDNTVRVIFHNKKGEELLMDVPFVGYTFRIDNDEIRCISQYGDRVECRPCSFDLDYIENTSVAGIDCTISFEGRDGTTGEAAITAIQGLKVIDNNPYQISCYQSQPRNPSRR